MTKVASGSALLGANTQAFIAKLGQPDPNGTTTGGSGVYNFKPCPGGHGDEFLVLFLNNQAIAITRQYCIGEAMPDASTRTALALTFAPADAVRHGQTTSENGSFAPVYLSKQLAKTIAADNFVDCNQNPDPPGTFALGLENGWDLIAGTCP